MRPITQPGALNWGLYSGNLVPESKYLTKCNSISHTEMLLYSSNIPISY